MTRLDYSILWVLVALLVSALTTGCAVFVPPPTPTPTPTVLPTATRTTVPTSAPRVTPSRANVAQAPIRTGTTSPAATVPPSATPTITLTPTRTRTPTITPTSTQAPPPTGRAARLDVTMRSASLGMDQKLRVYLPPSYYDSQRRYPVMYLLHGYGGPYNEWERWGLLDALDPAIRSGIAQPMIVVMPNGLMAQNIPSYFFNHAPTAGGAKWGDYIWKDVVAYVDANYRTLPQRESRAIGGISLGGQGALTLGMTHPEVFKVVGAHSPSFRGPTGWTDLPDAFFGTWEYYNQYDPYWLVQNTTTARELLIGIDVGTDDHNWRECDPGKRCINTFHQLLVEKGIEHDWQDKWTGGHDGITYWSPHMGEYINWYSRKLVGQ
ncbi:MAG: hypothetical protein HY868_22370 [Chloroflexi bacterium]|nr:hypothetical protein [Chloroflexota bacterium]